MPSVSIVMPFRNAEPTLGECLTSIRSQTMTDWELVAIDDGSSDGSAAIVSHLASSDSRVRLLSPGPVGLVVALDLGLAEARAPFVARMDADDVMAPERLALQLERLAADDGLTLVACQVRLFPAGEIKAGYHEYVRWQNACLTAGEISSRIYVESPFAHPSVMFRRTDVLSSGGYRDGAFPEDYELWLRLHEAGKRMEKIPRVLLDWRESASRLSRTDPRYDRTAFDRLRAEFLSRDPRLAGSRPVVFWGAGRRTRHRARHLVSRGISPTAYVDIDPRTIGRIVDDVAVHPPEWLAESPRGFVLAWVTNHGARELIASRLSQLGYAEGSDWIAVG